jgi:hypothetical protein
MIAKWLQKGKYYGVNIISFVVLRGLWLTRNDFIFNKHEWVSVKQILRRMVKLTMEWQVMFKGAKREEKKNQLSFLERMIKESQRIASD